MPKKNHQNEAVSSAKVPLSGPLGGRSPSSPIAPSAARRRNEVLSSAALPHLAEVAAGAKLCSRGTLRRPRDVGHHPGHGGLHPGEHMTTTPVMVDSTPANTMTTTPVMVDSTTANTIQTGRILKGARRQTSRKPRSLKRLNSSQARSFGPSSASVPSRSGAGGMTGKRAFPLQRSSTAGSILPWALLWLGSLGRRTGHERGSESLRNCPGKRSTLAASLSAARPRSRTAISC
jgi:hypothetical protein